MLKTSTRPVDPAKELRKVRRDLERLSNVVLLFIDTADRHFASDPTIPRAAGSLMAQFLNCLEQSNDQIRYSTLGVNYRTDDKPKAIRRLRRRGTV